MTRLLGSNCKAKSASCKTFFGTSLSIRVRFGLFYYQGNTYKKNDTSSVVILKEGQTPRRLWILALLFPFNRRKPKNEYEITFADGHTIAIEVSDPTHQKLLNEWKYSAKYK